jgi:hypothetical protein
LTLLPILLLLGLPAPQPLTPAVPHPLALLARVTWVEDPVAAEQELLSNVSFPLNVENQAPGAHPDWAAIRPTPLIIPGDDELRKREREFNEKKSRQTDTERQRAADAGGGGYFGC